MSAREDSLAALGFGALAAIALGVALIPLREATTAANLAFAFLALTILVGHAGGRGPAVATALVSALSLNFFLTRPYLTLAVHGQDDLIAFAGLAVCGLISATLGSRQAGRLERQKQRDVLDAALDRLTLGPADLHVHEVLESARTAFPLAAIALRDPGARLLAFVGDRTKVASDRELRAPADAESLPLLFSRQTVASLDLWSDGHPLDDAARRALRSLGHVLAALLVADRLQGAENLPRAPSAWAPLPHAGARE